MKLRFSSQQLLLLLLLALPLDSMAFTPDFKMIMSRVAKNHGRGFYKIIQDVILEPEPKNLVVRETWYIKDENQMRLEVSGRNRLRDLVNMTFIYNGNRRIYIDSRGVKKVSRPGEDWFEPYFHFRLQENIKPIMVAAKIAPAKVLKDDTKRRRFNPEKPYKRQPFLRLSRIGGVVAWAVGEPTPVGSTEILPGMWIEQDQFRIRQLRFSSQAVILANKYSRYSRGLDLPSLININWDNHQVQIQVVKAEPLPRTKKNKVLLSGASLDFSKNSSLSLKVPDIKTLTEFYKRFR